MKETALFYLRRYRNELEAKFLDHEAAAKQGMPYAERQKRVAEAERYKQEYEAICWAYDQIASR